MNRFNVKPDILIVGGTLLPMSSPGEIIENPSVGIKDGKVLFVDRNHVSSRDPIEANEIIDATGCIVMPGLVNVHTHLAMTCFRGLADDLPLMTWLNKHIFPAEKQFINRNTVYAGSLLAMAEMILSGTTTFCDGYFYEGQVARAAAACGMRGVISLGFVDFPAPGQSEDADKKVVAERFLNKWGKYSPLIKPSLICHSPYTCSPDTMKNIKDISRKYGVLFQIHLAETLEEVRIVQERYGKKPAAFLRQLDIMDKHTIAAHCVWMDDSEIDILEEFDVKVGHDPESNMKLGAGIARIPEMIHRGIEVGLGTDGCASNNDLDLFGEMGTAAKLHKVFSNDPTCLSAERTVEMATLGGARVLGMADRIGSIVPGKEADIILVDTKQPHLTPLYHPFSHIVYAARGADVVVSIIGGRVVMKNRRLLTIDLESAMEQVRRIASKIKKEFNG